MGAASVDHIKFFHFQVLMKEVNTIQSFKLNILVKLQVCVVIRRVCNVGNGLKRPNDRDSPVVIKCSTACKKKNSLREKKG